MTAERLSPRLVFEDASFRLAHAEGCLVPGYLVLWCKRAPLGLPQASAEATRRLGPLLGRAARAIAAAVEAERVYCLSFGELEPRLHFHLFPRTRWLLERYWEGTGSGRDPVNGPALFEWARTALVPGHASPPPGPGVDEVTARLRAALRRRRGGS
ncbi:MAG TPA: hypothetical protein VLW17_08110 [Thermoanaerobaculaceae bacterium]|nr:hypothetical protein [Thermoanaerobaculaceae bacterium]